MTTDQQNHGMGNGFQTFATKTSGWMGSRWSFLGAILIIVAWAVLGPYFHYSDTWQLVVNTATTIVTFLMVFLIQNTQNRDARALHLKQDEIIRAIESARNELKDIERLSDDDLEMLSKALKRFAWNANPEQGGETERMQSMSERVRVLR
jgi:low affinity Fe/Cu permease